MRVRLLALLVPALLAGCAEADPAAAPTTAPSAAPTAAPLAVPVSSAAVEPGSMIGTFLPYQPGATAITYDPRVVPPGATARVATSRSGGGDSVRLAVTGMVPRRTYGAHLHTQPCAAIPEAAGPHYQHEADPSKPSVDPSYANPDNEVWLDFTADGSGAAAVESVQSWTFDERNPPRSLIVHAEATRTGKGEAGTAGPRVACMSLSAS